MDVEECDTKRIDGSVHIARASIDLPIPSDGVAISNGTYLVFHSPHRTLNSPEIPYLKMSRGTQIEIDFIVDAEKKTLRK